MATDLVDDEVIEEAPPFSYRTIGLVLAICSAIGLFCAMALSIEKVHLLQNPDQALTCDLNAAVQCTDVMRSWQSSVFGFPNPFLGLVGFGITIAVGMALLAGARFARWYWIGLQLGVTFGAVFIHWLMINTLFDIGAMCPYCMVVWAITMPMFVVVTARNAHRYASGRDGALAGVAGFFARMAVALLIIWYVAAAALVLGMLLFVL
ncbi:vitamin K epoxide reductase family protein [Naumannella halotolerans]|uniref:Putative membrane protein n=1 Tax=Naumannella halotolerans TaxID=993414 RepID=A0A4R7J9W5_9ACTN|nr:vitamin K epoxide reductase family protein [Naumannella halotolerans]TDT34094.1 putative membrane protein [Naumannella halotolerans]